MEDKKNPWIKNDLWTAELEFLTAIMLETEMEETTKWGGTVYTINGKTVVGLGGFKSYVGIWFYQGALLEDHAQVLTTAQEGVTKAMRQWRFTGLNEIKKQEPLIRSYVIQAIENAKAGKEVKPEKKAEIQSEMLQQEFTINPELKTAFEQFPPYKKREFIEFIESAKRHETKLVRLEKIKPLILENRGLNDKYK